MAQAEGATARPWWRRHLGGLLKIAVGVAILLVIASKLTINDELGVANRSGEPTLISGRSLHVEGSVTLVARDGQRHGPFSVAEDPPRMQRRPGAWRLTLTDGTVLEGQTLERTGSATLDEDGIHRRFPLSDLAWKDLGKEGSWVEKQLHHREGLASIYGRLSVTPYLMGFFSILAMYLCGIRRWQLLLRAQEIRVSFWEATRLTFIGFFFNNVVPGMTGGDLVKAILIARAHPGRGPDAVSTVIVDRVIGILVLAAMAAAVLLFTFDRYQTIATWVFLILAGAVVGLSLFLSRRVRRALRIDRLLNRLPGSDTLKRLDSAFLLYRSRKSIMAWAVGISVVSHFFNVLSVYLMGMDLGVGPDRGLEEPALLTYFAVVPIIMIVSAVPALPGGWGVGEAAFGYFFRTVGIHNLSLSVGLSVLHRVSMLLWSLTGGVFLFLRRAEAREALQEADGQTR